MGETIEYGGGFEVFPRCDADMDTGKGVADPNSMDVEVNVSDFEVAMKEKNIPTQG